MLRLAYAQLRFRPGRSAALIAVLIATVACFAMVDASAETEQVTVHGTLEADSRASYDLLVRPARSVTATERQHNLVSSTAMSSIDGGITLAQWHKVEQIPACTQLPQSPWSAMTTCSTTSRCTCRTRRLARPR
jgi:hypothetical protein